MNDTTHTACPRCQRPWLVQRKKPIFKGTRKQLQRLESEQNRKWNCGTNLYNGGK